MTTSGTTKQPGADQASVLAQLAALQTIGSAPQIKQRTPAKQQPPATPQEHLMSLQNVARPNAETSGAPVAHSTVQEVAQKSLPKAVPLKKTPPTPVHKKKVTCLSRACSGLGTAAKFVGKVIKGTTKAAVVTAALLTAGSFAMNAACDRNILVGAGTCEQSLPYTREVAETTSVAAQALYKTGEATLWTVAQETSDIGSEALTGLQNTVSAASEFVTDYFAPQAPETTGVFGWNTGFGL